MITQKKSIYYLLTFCTVFCIILFNNADSAEAAKKKPVKVTSVKITNITKTYTIKKGSSKTISVKVYPSNATIKKLKWTSSDPKVVYVNSNGKIVGKKAGKAVITATAKDGSKKKISYTIHVGTRASSLSFESSTAVAPLPIGRDFTRKINVNPTTTTIKKLTWTSSDTGVAKVSSKGTVTGLKKGSVTISAITTDGTNKKLSYKIQVIQHVTSIKLVKASGNCFVQKGSSFSLLATVSPTSANNKKLTWSSSNTSVATINSSGLINAVGNGTTTIRATAKDGSQKYKTYKVQVLSLSSTSTNFVAHRGLSAMAPENSLAAYELACNSDYWGIEADMWETTDKEFVLTHDNSLKRMCGVDVDVTKFTLDAIRKYKMTMGANVDKYPNEQIPTLKELLDLAIRYPDKKLLLELKDNLSNDSIIRLLQLVHEYGLEDRVTISSFIESNLLAIKMLDIPEIVLPDDSDDTEPIDEEDISKTEYRQLDLQRISASSATTVVNWCIKYSISLITNYRYLSQSTVDAMHKSGLTVGVYTIDDFNTAFNYVKNVGVDFLTSNYKLFD